MGRAVDVGGRFAPHEVDEGWDFKRRAPWFDVHYGIFTERPEWVRAGLSGLRSRL